MEIKNEKEFLTIRNKDGISEEEFNALIEYNTKLVSVFPFLKYDKENNYTWLDCMPDGWRLAFGLKMCLEVRSKLVDQNRLDKYQIVEIKEKWGGLRWYDNGCNNDLFKVLNNYENLSLKTCIKCGKPAVYSSTGWISPYCEDCAKEIFEEDKQYYKKDEIKFEDRFIPLELV